MCREIYVVTKVPAWPISSNHSHEHIYMVETDRGKYTFYVLDDWSSVSLAKEHRAIEIPVEREIFHLGEVIVCDGAGREVGGFQRKPYKWGWVVSDDPLDNHHKNTGLWFEEFDNLGDALDCARKALEERMTPPTKEPEEEGGVNSEPCPKCNTSVPYGPGTEYENHPTECPNCGAKYGGII